MMWFCTPYGFPQSCGCTNCTCRLCRDPVIWTAPKPYPQPFKNTDDLVKQVAELEREIAELKRNLEVQVA